MTMQLRARFTEPRSFYFVYVTIVTEQLCDDDNNRYYRTVTTVTIVTIALWWRNYDFSLQKYSETSQKSLKRCNAQKSFDIKKRHLCDSKKRLIKAKVCVLYIHAIRSLIPRNCFVIKNFRRPNL